MLDYLAHSSFLITCGSTRLLFDPWLKGPAYYKQWFLWPPAAMQPEEIELDLILISHGHEDHLHPETLKSLNKSAHIFFPFQWRAGIKSYLQHIGFRKISEAISFRKYFVNDVAITYISYSLESVIVIEYKNEVLVNINDALNSNHETAVKFILNEIKKRWNKITYLLSGWSGAGYFPNQVRYAGKDDEEIGRMREQYFANNFFRFVHALSPAYALPFAPGFVLLKKNNQWINHVKFPRSKVGEYYRKYYPSEHGTEFIVAYPGDKIEGTRHVANAKWHNISEAQHYDYAYRHYHLETEEINRVASATDEEVINLIGLLDKWTNHNKILYHDEVLKDIVFSLRLEDMRNETYLNIFYNGKKFIIEKSPFPFADRRVCITAPVKQLLYALKKTWGGDVLTIGYGLTIEIYDERSLEKNLDIVCVRLITRYPIVREDILKYPVRALKFYTHNPMLTSLWIKQKIKLKPYVNKYPFNERDHWLTYSKCDLCAVCKMPVINQEDYA